MQPDLTVGIDELTVVLQSKEQVDLKEWPGKAEEIIANFTEKAKLQELFGPMDWATGRLQAGYTNGLTYANQPWHFQICFSDIPSMGVCVHFSAFAWYVYQQDYAERFGVPVDLAEFLYMVQDTLYSLRLSRVDLTADYKNYPCPLNPSAQLSPGTLYEQLMAGNYRILDYRGRSTIREFSAIHEDGVFQTLYIGSRKGKSNSFLRIYNKKREQIVTKGYRCEEALQCESWCRFEAVLRHDAAHNFTDVILNFQQHKLNLGSGSQPTLASIIASTFYEKWQFYDVAADNYLDITDDLAGIANGTILPSLFSAAHPRDNTLKQSIEYLRGNSGLYACLYKAFALYDGKADRELMDYFWDDYINSFKVRLYTGQDKAKLREMRMWLKAHKDEITKFPLESYLDRSQHDTTGFEIPSYE